MVYTAMLNARGGFESDLTVMRLAADRFLLITGSAQPAVSYTHLHGLGLALAIAALPLLVVFANQHGSAADITAAALFGASMRCV